MPKNKTKTKNHQANVSRPQMPDSYRLKEPKGGKGFLDWQHVEERMQAAHNYWVVTTGKDGRPHTMPVWGVWVEGVYYFSTDRRTRKARNLAANSAVIVHLESGDEVIILEGIGAEVTDEKQIAAMDAAYFAKYKMHPLEIPGDVSIYEVKPLVAFAWFESNFADSATRWSLKDGKSS